MFFSRSMPYMWTATGRSTVGHPKTHIARYSSASFKGCCLNPKGWSMGTPYHPFSTPCRIQWLTRPLEIKGFRVMAATDDSLVKKSVNNYLSIHKKNGTFSTPDVWISTKNRSGECYEVITYNLIIKGYNTVVTHTIPYHPCMVCLPTITIKINHSYR